MKDLISYLNALKAKLDIKSDTQLAARLGITQASIQKYMVGMAVPADEVCIKIAELSGDSPTIVMALADVSRAKGTSKKYRTQIYKAVMTAALSLLFFIPSSAYATVNNSSILQTVYYVKSHLFLDHGTRAYTRVFHKSVEILIDAPAPA